MSVAIHGWLKGKISAIIRIALVVSVVLIFQQTGRLIDLIGLAIGIAALFVIFLNKKRIV